MSWLTFIISCFLALVHVAAGRLRFLRGGTLSRWLSFAGGVSIAFVFTDIIPGLGKAQDVIEASGRTRTDFEGQAYLVALAGLIIFYGLEKLALASRREQEGNGGDVPPGIFWIHLIAFALFNLIVGYLLAHRERHGPWSLTTYAFAFGLHFFVSDFSLQQDNAYLYRVIGRWVLASSVVGGWALSMAIQVSAGVIILLFGMLAGGIILDVLDEELPEKRESSFWAFVLGCVVYAALAILA